MAAGQALDVDRPIPPTQRGRIGLIVSASLLGGALLAILLAVIVFGGSIEPVTAGLVLLAFAASWGALAWLSQRLTDQPQRWAWLLAGVFGVIGVLYLVLRPSTRVLDASGWVWPFLLIGLAVWIAVHSRRHLRNWARRIVIYPIVAIMAVSAVGSGYETVREAMDSAAHKMSGQLVSVGDHKLHINCTGAGSPTVILEAGLGEPGVMMAGWIQPAVAATTRVCVYDRAGRGDSEAGSGVRDGLSTTADLHRLLANANVPGPYVLVGHSSGGVYVRVYAHQYPDQVAGMVLLDGQPGDVYAKLPGWATFYAGLRKYTGVAPSLARLGAIRLSYASQVGGLPPAARAEERNDWSTARHNRSLRDEVAGLRTALTQSQALTTFGAKPLIVLTAMKDAQKGWLPLQDEMVALSTNSVHRLIAGATHASLTEDSHFSGVSAQAIIDVVTAVRTGAPLANS
jgi:pimeloyl-ACP methyl ester carboxylesterase